MLIQKPARFYPCRQLKYSDISSLCPLRPEAVFVIAEEEIQARLYAVGTTFAAAGPLAPFSMVNSTFWPSDKVR
ncbi:protein of unknown function [Xenorhabdus nematophila AN6/1]|nr:hypothetical protein XNW1_4150005 [Xenorhabdus nematophila str. Websteri]CEF33901.1 hypothetical protein XNW1_620005 [Xenorhabdus nematophila str. Websteri]CEK22937.1 protein of unknown function [Xenorhabdus nematophila AN6/1]